PLAGTVPRMRVWVTSDGSVSATRSLGSRRKPAARKSSSILSYCRARSPPNASIGERMWTTEDAGAGGEATGGTARNEAAGPGRRGRGAGAVGAAWGCLGEFRLGGCFHSDGARRVPPGAAPRDIMHRAGPAGRPGGTSALRRGGGSAKVVGRVRRGRRRRLR